jgi:hypothetical protein
LLFFLLLLLTHTDADASWREKNVAKNREKEPEATRST